MQGLQAPGLFQWNDIPAGLQESILDSKALTLLDLIKLAETAPVFRAAYLRRCQAEDRWLTQSAIAVFSENVAETLLEFLTPGFDYVNGGPGEPPYDLPITFILNPGQQCPSPFFLLTPRRPWASV